MAHRISSLVPLLFITLLCVGCVEGGYLALEYFLMKNSVDRGDIVEESLKKMVQKPEITQQKHDYKVILRRNLFGLPPTDKKVGSGTEVSDLAEDLETTSLDITLKGTVNGEGKSKRAIILDKKTKKQELFQEGDGIQGAFVKEILRNKVILSFNGKDEVLEMSDTAGSAEPAGPVAVTPGKVPRNVGPQGSARVQRRMPRRVVRPRKTQNPQPVLSDEERE